MFSGYEKRHSKRREIRIQDRRIERKSRNHNKICIHIFLRMTDGPYKLYTGFPWVKDNFAKNSNLSSITAEKIAFQL